MTLKATEASPASDVLEAEAIAPEAVVDAPDANAADSSPVDDPDANKPANLLDVVKSAVAPVVEAAAPSPASESEEAAASEAEGEKPQAEVVDDADLPFHNHPRWKEVIAERDGYREDATQYGKITGFMQEHGLASEEVSEGFEVMALLKSGDPTKLAEAREWFNVRLQVLDEQLGNVLPDDLRERVEAGLIDDEGAQEIARARATAKITDEQRTARAERETADEAQRSREKAATEMVSAVDGWETRTKASDPDYSKKAALVQTTCQAIVHRTGKPPANSEEAVALVEAAYAEVNANLVKALPPKRPVAPTPRGSSTPTVGAPKTLREAIAAAASGG